MSLELSRVTPIKDVANSTYQKVLEYARQVRMSGSDIVVEEDLATLFGQVRVSPELEEQYRQVVKIQRFVPLYKGCEIRLDAGAGPTVQHALKNRAYMATVMQLSMLAYFHGQGQLAMTLSRAIAKRFESRIADALPDPGAEGITRVIEAISSQTCAFGWHVFSQRVEDQLRTQIPGFRYREEYSRLSPNVILGSLDFLVVAQNLPSDRRISLSTEVGCIPFIVWTHYILQFTVVITGELSQEVVFGDATDIHPCVYICWTGDRRKKMQEASIKLHEKEMAVILEIAPEEDPRFLIASQERHAILGYGTTFLKRLFNRTTITPETETLYGDSVKYIIANTIRVSRRICFDAKMFPFRCPSRFEIWRILKVGTVLFHGLPLEAEEIRTYTEYSGQDEIGQDILPPAFNAYLEKAKGCESLEWCTADLIAQFSFPVRLIVALCFVANFDECVSMPIIYRQGRNSWFHNLESLFDRTRQAEVSIRPQIIPIVITELLTSGRGGHHDSWDAAPADSKPFLWSDFGWSIFLDIIGDKDPSDVQIGVAHVKIGVPTRQGTNERRFLIADGNVPPLKRQPESPLLRGDHYTPRAAASVTSRQEFWSVRPDRFELSVVYSVQLKAEWLQHPGAENFEEVINYYELYAALVNTPFTPACKHVALSNKSHPESDPPSQRLGPDAVATFGIGIAGTDVKERVLVILAKGEPVLRWSAIKRYGCGYRPGIVLTDDCCEECALNLIYSKSRKWTLIL